MPDSKAAERALSGTALIKQASVYGIFTVVRRALSFLLTPIYTYYLSPKDFGVLEVLNVGALLVGILGAFKLDAAFYRFYAVQETQDGRRRVLAASLFTTLGIATLLVGTGVAVVHLHALPGRFDIPAIAFHLVLATIWFELASCVPMAYCRATDRVTFVGSVSALQGIATGVTAIGLLTSSSLGYQAILVGNLVGTVLLTVASMWALRGERLSLGTGMTGALLKYAVPLLPGSLFTYVLNSGDRYFLAHFDTMGQVGIYAVATKFPLALQVLVMAPFAEMWAANQFRLFAQHQRSLYQRMALGYLGVLFQLALGIAFFSYELIHVAFNEAYHGAFAVVPLAVLGVAIWGIVPTMDLGALVAPGKTWLRSVATGLGALASVGANLILVPRYGIQGAAVAMVIGSTVLVVATTALNARLTDMRAPVPTVAGLTLALMCVAMFSYAAPWMRYSTFLAGRIVLFLAFGALVVRTTGYDLGTQWRRLIGNMRQGAAVASRGKQS